MKLILFITMFVSSAKLLAGTTYVYCHDKKPLAYSDAAMRKRVANLDWICGLSTEKFIKKVAGIRCPTAVKSFCQVGKLAGGDKNVNGFHDVPHKAWFTTTSSQKNVMVRCQCGCFHPDTLLKTADGTYKSVFKIMEDSKQLGSSFLVRENLEDAYKFKASKPYKISDFTVGPEKPDLVKVELSNGRTLLITSEHPVLVKNRSGHQEMITAKTLVSGEVLYGEKNEEITASFVSRVPSNNVEVINFGLPGDDTASQIVLAEGVQVGNNVWQKILASYKARLELREAQKLN